MGWGRVGQCSRSSDGRIWITIQGICGNLGSHGIYPKLLVTQIYESSTSLNN